MHGRKTGDRFPVPVDNHLFAVLNEIKKVRELGFGFVYAEFHGLDLSLVQCLGPSKSAIFAPRIGHMTPGRVAGPVFAKRTQFRGGKAKGKGRR